MLGFALTAAAAVSVGGYQAMAPTGQWYGRTFAHSPRGSKQLALTYDDGPNDPHTLRLLEILAKHNVHTTFFLIGRYTRQRPDIVRELVRAGHVIGNHTFNHPLLIFKSSKQIETELTECQRILFDSAGLEAKIFRPPFGGRRPAVLRLARKLALQPVMWNITGYDWNAPAEQIERRVSRRIRGGDVILLHDGGHRAFGADRAQTMIATDRLLSRHKSEGYEFVTIPEMMSESQSAG
jgi:peptidoglycan-N-acetylglucosamine deacetylase